MRPPLWPGFSGARSTMSFPMSPRLAPLKAILAKLDPAADTHGAVAAASSRRCAIRGRQTPPPRMKPYRGPPMTLGNAAAAMVRLIV
jgi:hypothetical protein